MIFNPDNQRFESTILFAPPTGELLPEVEAVVLGHRTQALLDSVEAQRAAWRESLRDDETRFPSPTGPLPPHRILHLMLADQSDATVARAREHVAAARAEDVALIAVAVLGPSLSDAAGALTVEGDCALVSVHPAGLLHLLRLFLPPPQQVIGYDLADVLAVWRGGFGRVVALPDSEDLASV